MNDLRIFENEEFGNVRIMDVDGTPFFIANDVAKALGYSNPSKATNDHCKNSIMRRGNDSLGREQEFKIIPEGDVYRLIIKSKLPSAEKFESWVMDEVLPTIRKTGGYINNADLMVNTYFGNVSEDQKCIIKGLLSNIETIQSQNIALNNENSILAKKELEWADRKLINALVRKYASETSNDFARSWNLFKKELLYKHGININLRIAKYANDTGKKTKPRTLDMINDDELLLALGTIVSMCRESNVNITELLKKTNNNI